MELPSRSGSTWTPLLAAREVTPGRWFMIDGLDHPYGEILLERVDGVLAYTADRTDERGNHTVHIGRISTLAEAARLIHVHFIRSHGGPPRTSYSA